MKKLVAVEEPTTNEGIPEPRPLGLIENKPNGVLVPIPTYPESLMMNLGVEEPMTKGSIPIGSFKPNNPRGVVVPIPTRLLAWS
ncbi:MAG: hypothetical protein HYW71_03370 [Candidatus Niyogibacteria bacterium]|nr:hypothetical protein [Candidatus Niyogibacteria bacterium]